MGSKCASAVRLAVCEHLDRGKLVPRVFQKIFWTSGLIALESLKDMLIVTRVVFNKRNSRICMFYTKVTKHYKDVKH